MLAREPGSMGPTAQSTMRMRRIAAAGGIMIDCAMMLKLQPPPLDSA